MIPLFIGLTAFNLICLMAAAGLGYASVGGADTVHWHLLAGVLAAIACIAVHCVVFTYFIATGKWIQHAIAVKHLPGELAAPTRSFKAQAFPAALAAMTFTAATAVLGAAHDSYGLSAHWHHAAAIGTIALNAAVAIAEYHAISRNGRLIDDILGRIQREQSAAA